MNILIINNEGGIVQNFSGRKAPEAEPEAEYAEYEEVKPNGAAKAKPDAKPEVKPECKTAGQVTFAERTKAIMRKAATKNGQRIESNARGNAGSYIYNVDAECFCRAMDDMVKMHSEKLLEFLGGAMECVQVTKVCFFIGQVLSRQIINDAQLQLADVFFAFEEYYTLTTVQSRLSIRRCTSEENLLLGTFEGLLKKYKG